MSNKELKEQNTNFIDEQLLLNFMGDENLKCLTLLWTPDCNKISDKLQRIIGSNPDLILTDILPDELPSKTTYEEYVFFIERYRFFPPFYRKESKFNNQTQSRRKILYITDYSERTISTDKTLEFIISSGNIEDNLITLDANNENIKNTIDEEILQAKKVVINSLNPNITHYISILCTLHEIKVSVISPFLETSSRSILFGYNVFKKYKTENISLRYLFKEIILSREGNLILNDPNDSFSYSFNCDEDKSNYHKIDEFNKFSAKFFRINHHVPYSFNPTIKNDLKIEFDFCHLNRFQLCFNLNYIDYIKNLPQVNTTAETILSHLIDHFFLHWINSEKSELTKRLLISFIIENENCSERLIYISQKINDKKMNISFFGILGECFLRAASTTLNNPKISESFKRHSLKCLEIQKNKSSYNNYRFCLEFTQLLHENNDQISSIDFGNYYSDYGKDHLNSLNLMSILPYYLRAEEVIALPFKSMTTEHISYFIDGLMAKHGYSILEILWHKTFEINDLPKDVRQLLLTLYENSECPPWTLIFISMLIKPSVLPKAVNLLPTQIMIYMSYGFKKYGLLNESTEMLNLINKKEIVNITEAVFLLGLFEKCDIKFFDELIIKFNLNNLIENKEVELHPNLYPLVYKLSEKLSNSTNNFWKRLSDSSSPFYNFFN